MNYRPIIRALVTLGLGLCATSYAAASDVPDNDARLLEKSRQYSEKLVGERPELGLILKKLNLRYLHELDPAKVYNLNLDTGVLSVLDAEASTAAPAAVPGFSFGTPKVVIGASGNAIVGEASTTVTCLFGGQLAEVHGFMASTVSRDPVAGVREGTLVVDNFLSSKSVANFSILKLAGGARNPANRTVLESTHTGSCGNDLRVANLVTTWPPLRMEMVVDDTGSMGSELAGAKAGLASFIALQQEPGEYQREVSYELISFKDSPTLRLANTTDANAALAAVQSLYASGGGDCPEESLGAMNLALSRLDEAAEGAIVLVTDASPRSGDVSGFIAAAQAAGVKVHVLLSGDCVAAATAAATRSDNGDEQARFAVAAALSARTTFERIARETGGMYFYLPGGTAQDYADILEEIFSEAYSGDNEPPVVTVTASPGVLWPANHRLVPININVTAEDDKDPNPAIALEKVTSTEPDDGLGDGDTDGDIVIGADGTISLRAERSGNGPGRVYTITWRATDASGNVGFGSAEVVVPHSH